MISLTTFIVKDPLRVYQTAVAARDIDRMVAVKDFEYEARQMLRGKGQGIDGDPEVTALAASTLEAAFRAEWQNRQVGTRARDRRDRPWPFGAQSRP